MRNFKEKLKFKTLIRPLNAFEGLAPLKEMKPDTGVTQSANHWVELYLVSWPFVFFSKADIILQFKRLFEEM